MIVQCENCETRFHVADARIPEKGARVRCSRCHHRFHITPSSGTTSSPNSGPDVSARTETKSRETEAPPGGGGGDDLENPEFLFEGNSVSETPKRAKGAPEREPEPESEPEPEAVAATPQPEPARPPSPDLEPDQVPEVRVVETGGKTAQEMLDAGAPKLAKGPRVEFAESLADPASDDDDDTRSRFMLGDEPPAATPREAPPSLRPAKDKPAKPVATLTPIIRPPVPAPKPAAPKSAKSEIDAAFGAGLGDEEESDPGWESLTQSDESEAKSVFDVGASFGLGAGGAEGASDAPIAASESKPVTLFDQGAGGKKRQAAVFDPEAPSPAGLIARVVAALVGVALLGGALRGLALQRAATLASTQAEEGAGWVATDVETFVARDSLGERVLVVRGNLFPNGAAPPPEVEVALLGNSGERVGEPRRAWLERLDDAEIAPDALTVRLASSAGELSGVGPQITGFTALLADPPAAARRVQVNLAQGKAVLPPGIATATTPPPAPAPAALPAHDTQLAAPATPPAPAPVTPPAPAHDTQLATPSAPAPAPQPSQVKPDAVVPASPAPEPD